MVIKPVLLNNPSKFGLTRERVRQLEKQALSRLRHPRRSRQLRAYLDF